MPVLTWGMSRFTLLSSGTATISYARESVPARLQRVYIQRMKISDPIALAVIGGAVTLTGYFVTSSLERRRTARIREMEFRLDRYKELITAFTEQSGRYTYETHLRFVNALNGVLLIGGTQLLRGIQRLVENYNDPEGTAAKSSEILDSILYSMRHDLGAPDTKGMADFYFPIIVPDLERLQAEAERLQNDNPDHA
jgi:hypothetical protein